MTEILLQSGADVKLANRDKETALHLSNNIKIAEMLLKYSADINALDILD